MPEFAPAGWYPGPDGIPRYWDGSAWVAPAPGPAAGAPGKNLKYVGTAYCFWLFFGITGAHRLYVRRPLSAVLLLAAFVLASVLFIFSLQPWPLLAVFAWVAVDGFFLSRMVAKANAQA